MKLISFDIGIKNMAYCIFYFSNGTLVIQDWGILNLMDQSISNDKQKCTCALQVKTSSKRKKNDTKHDTKHDAAINFCGKNAKYEKSNNYYCEMHAKMADPSWIFPCKELTPGFLKKCTLDALTTLGNKYNIFEDNLTRSKKTSIEQILDAFSKRGFQSIVKPKIKTASETDLITVGRNMQIQLYLLQNVHDITHVIMENQISPLASRMKTVQGMLTQYFIMKNVPTIEFISSANKLKHLVPKEPLNKVLNKVENKVQEITENEQKENTTLSMDKNKYKKHKTDSIAFCQQFLKENPELGSWTHLMDENNKGKRDDLADCFLQGIWYLVNIKLINYAYNLKINSV